MTVSDGWDELFSEAGKENDKKDNCYSFHKRQVDRMKALI
jgi:hypothetical protein